MLRKSFLFLAMMVCATPAAWASESADDGGTDSEQAETATDDEGSADVKEDSSAQDDAASEQGEASKQEETKAPEQEQSDAGGEESWVEHQDQTYRFVGVRGRAVVIPKFMFSLYQADGGKTVVSPSVGPEFSSRRNGFGYSAWLTYSSYRMDDVPFKAKSDPDVAYELVTTRLAVLTLGADFLWSVPIDSGFSFVYGGGAGLGVVFGDLYRVQAYPPNGVPGDPTKYVKCKAPGDGTGNYCANDNDHYGDYSEPSWLDGGSKPVIFPWIALPQIGLRWKASHDFVMRLDTGLSFPGPFFLGLSAAYGLPD